MYSQEVLLELIELVYAAAGDPAKWASFLERLVVVFKANVATIHHQHQTSLESSFAVTWNMDPTALNEYTAYYGPLNVWFTGSGNLNREGNAYTSHVLFPDDLLVRTEFYNDWLRPQNMQQGAGATILKNGQVTSILSIFSGNDRASFGESDVEFLRALMPHLQRAFQLHNRIQGLETKANTAVEILDHFDQGIVLLDAKGGILLVNQAATTLLANEKALKITPRAFIAAIPSENQQLAGLIRGAIAIGEGKGLHAGGVIEISRGGLRRPLQILVMPLRTKTIYLGRTMPVVAIFISDPDRKLISNVALFVQLFGLTPAEARLAQMLAGGGDLKEASQRLGISLSTLRSQLKSIFAKTNTNRQSQLVRLLLLAPGQLAQSRIAEANVHR